MAYIKIIGTSHIASQSVRQIKQVFRVENRPDLVAIELDKARAEQIFKEPRSIKLRDAFQLGFMGYAFASVGGFIQRKFGSKVGLRPGEDMRTAIMEAKRYALPLFLIDQPIQKTLSNMSKKMSFWEKSKLGFYSIGILFIPFTKIFKRGKKVDLSKVPSSDIIENSVNRMKTGFPGLHEALITDRNKHMVRHIKYIAARHPDKKLVVVVGAGHKGALEKALIEPAVAS